MSKPNDDPLLRAVMRATHGAAPDGDCPDAELLALYAEQELGAEERAGIDGHVTGCGRCQESLAAFVRSAPVDASAASVGAGVPWWMGWRWLVPLASAAVVVVALWVGQGPSEQVAESARAASSPVADRVEQIAPPSDAFANAAREEALRDERSTALSTPTSAAATASAEDRGAPAQSREAEQGSRAKAAEAPATTTFRAADGVSPDSEGKTKSAEAATSVVVGGLLAETDPAAPRVPAEVDRIAVAERRADLGRSRQLQELAAAVPTEPPSPPAAVAPPAPPAFGAVGERENAAPARRLEATADEKVETAGRDLDAASREAFRVAARWRVRDGAVERTQDEGVSWQRSVTPAGVRVVAVASPSADVCWAIGSRAVLRTLDGTTWTRVATPSGGQLQSITATDTRNAVVTTAGGARFVTSDGGATWRALP